MLRSIGIWTQLAVLMFASMAAAPTATAEIKFAGSIGLNYSTVDNVFIGGHLIEDPPPTLDPRGTFSGTGLRVSGSADWGSWLSIEIGWSQFGKEDAANSHFIDFVCPSLCPPGEGLMIDQVEQRGSALWLAAVPTYRAGQWEVFAKVGVSRVDVESRQMTDPANRLRVSDTDLVLGAGAFLHLAHGFGLRFDVERLSSRAHQIGLSLAYRF